MSRQHRQVVVRDSEHTNLVLFGDSAFAPHQPAFFAIENAGREKSAKSVHFSDHNEKSDALSRQIVDPLKVIDTHSHIQAWNIYNSRYTTGGHSPENDDRKGFFHRPLSVIGRPESSLFHSAYEGDGTQGRPNSVASVRPDSVLAGRPPSGASRPGSAIRRAGTSSRPASRSSRPSSAYSRSGKPDNAWQYVNTRYSIYVNSQD